MWGGVLGGVEVRKFAILSVLIDIFSAKGMITSDVTGLLIMSSISCVSFYLIV